MKKIFLRLSFCVALVFLLCLTAFAFETPSEYEGTQYGASYDTSHDSGCCTPDGSGSYNHYDEGYKDGFNDGYQSGLEGNELSEEEKQAFLSQYFESQDYKDRIAQAQEQAVNNYKNSSQFNEDAKNAASSQGAIREAYDKGYEDGALEYKTSEENENALYSEYQNGVNAGYNSGYNTGYAEAEEAVYAKGVAEGFANFRESAEYENTLQAQFDGGYNRGYADGAADRESSNLNEGVNLSSIITLILSIFSIGALFLFISIRKKKNERKRK